MGLFGSYQNAGPGINPHAPKKKPFFRFWELMWRNMSKLLGLNLIYTLLHAPLLLSLIVYIEAQSSLKNAVTIALLVIQFILEGPIMAGCARVLRLIVLDKAFFLGDEFKKGFSKNFGMGVAVWLIDAVVIASLVAGYYVYPALSESYGTKLVYIPFGISMAVGLLLLFMNYYLLPLQVATRLKPRSVFKNAFMLACLAPKQCIITTLGSVFMIGLSLLLVLLNSYFMFLFAFFPAAFVGYLVLFMNYPVIQKYVINPYYEDTGEQNPEAEEEIPEEERVFTDRGGTETPVKKQKQKRGRTIS